MFADWFNSIIQPETENKDEPQKPPQQLQQEQQQAYGYPEKTTGTGLPAPPMQQPPPLHGWQPQMPQAPPPNQQQQLHSAAVAQLQPGPQTLTAGQNVVPARQTSGSSPAHPQMSPRAGERKRGPSCPPKREPPPEDPVKLSQDVAEFCRNSVGTAWQKFEKEWTTLQQIWESQSQLYKTKSEKVTNRQAKLQGRVKEAMQHKEGQDLGKAAEVLSGALNADGQSEEKLNPVSQARIQDVVNATQSLVHADRLISLIQTPMPAGYSPQPQEVQEWTRIAESCRLDAALERRVRRRLGLGLSKADAEAEAARQKQQAEKKALLERTAKEEARLKAERQRKLYQEERLACIARETKMPIEKVKKVVGAHNWDFEAARQALTAEREKMEAREKRASSRVSKRATNAENMMAKEAADLAKLLDNLGKETFFIIWKTIREAFQVQMRVWESAAATQGKTAEYAEITSRMKVILSNSATDPHGQVEPLFKALQVAESRRLLVSEPMMKAAQETQGMDDVSRYRNELAQRLQQLSAPGALKKLGDRERQDILALVELCKLDHSLKTRVKGCMETL
eukprot:TRINITY_DN124436_c0_g1_i1.p1 TRINITY_DN124436_c0_g1~~TRINITY_DN124436_c0_g1_i1.p1  ORF type:complete len:568 (-),score=164.64 TRINITY_DN124436_c0_g1_i1:26-1729(-)